MVQSVVMLRRRPTRDAIRYDHRRTRRIRHDAAHAARMAPAGDRRDGGGGRLRPWNSFPAAGGGSGAASVRRRPDRDAELQLPRHGPRRGTRRDAGARHRQLRALVAPRRAARAVPPGKPRAAAGVAHDRPARPLPGGPDPAGGRRRHAERVQPELPGRLLGRGDRPRLQDGAGARGTGHHRLGAAQHRAAHRPDGRTARRAGGDAQPCLDRPERVRVSGRLRPGDPPGRVGPDRRQPGHRPHGGRGPRPDRLPEGQPPADRHPPPQGPEAEPGPQRAVGRGRHADPRDAPAPARRRLGYPGQHRVRVPGRRHPTELRRCLDYCKDALGV